MITRRLLLTSVGLTAAGVARAQDTSRPFKIGVMADQNGIYSDVTGRGTVEAARLAVGKQMRATPVNDFYNHDIRIRTDGRVLQDMMLWHAKAPAESKGKTDLLAITQTVPGSEVYRPETEGGCPLVRS